MAEQDSLSDPAGFDRMYQQQGSPIRQFLRLLLGNSAAADDLTQETFLHLWRSPSSFDPGRGGIKSYLLGVARKKAADWWRHNKPDPSAIAKQTLPPDDTLSIRDALHRLPEELRTILWLREVEGCSYEELARILKVPIGTVRSRLHAARQQLRIIWLKEAQ